MPAGSGLGVGGCDPIARCAETRPRYARRPPLTDTAGLQGEARVVLPLEGSANNQMRGEVLWQLF